MPGGFFVILHRARTCESPQSNEFNLPSAPGLQSQALTAIRRRRGTDAMLKKAVLAVLLTMVGCSQYSLDPSIYPPPLAATADTSDRPFPAKRRLEPLFSPASLEIADCMSPVDTIDGHPPVTVPYSSRERVKIMGWNLVGGAVPTPTRIHGAFAPYAGKDPVAVLDGIRLPRSDVAAGNRRFLMAGYELDGRMPDAPGYYRFFIVTGTADVLQVCDTKIVLTVH
jgi:hypothetical protein